MSEQRWFAGLPVVSQRELDSGERERFGDFAAVVWGECLASHVLLVLVLALAVAASLINLATLWAGPVTLIAFYALGRFLPKRRFISLRVLLRLRRDRAAGCVYVCRTDDASIEVLTCSHLLWSRDGALVELPFVVHASTTALAPEHAAMAANFVRPLADRDDILVHQRLLTEAELRELDSYAPRPELTILLLAAVALFGSVATFGLALQGRSTTLLPPFAFLIIAAWAGWRFLRARRARAQIAADVEAGIVYIVRASEGGELGPPQEVLPYSNIVWSEGGMTAEWRKYFRKER